MNGTDAMLERVLAGGGGRGASDIVAEVVNQLGGGKSDASTLLATQLEQVRMASQTQAEAVLENTLAVMSNTTAQTSSSGGGGSSALKTAGEVAWKVLGSGLGLSPLISGLVKLFGGGQTTEEPPPLTVYEPPQPLRLEGSVLRQAGETEWSAPEPAGQGRAVPVTMPQVTIQVSAMDSQSFLDHSDDIARAVKQAMLNSNALNDVVNEL